MATTTTNSTSLPLSYFQANQLISDSTGRITPFFANTLNNTIKNLQNQLTSIETLFKDLDTTNSNIDDLNTNLANFQTLIKTFQTDIDYLRGFSSYTTGVSISCSALQTISVSSHIRHFCDGTTTSYPSTTWDLQSPDTTYYIFMDALTGDYHHSTDINDMIQTGTRYCVGSITTPKLTATAGTTGNVCAQIGQTFI